MIQSCFLMFIFQCEFKGGSVICKRFIKASPTFLVWIFKMIVQIAISSEFPFTDITLESFFSSVNFNMSLQITFQCECFCTLFTFERLLHNALSVNFKVWLKSTFMNECFFAEFTYEERFLGMILSMIHQTAFRSVCLITMITFEWFFICVNSLMLCQPFFMTESLCTIGTMLFSSVNF